MLAPKIISHFPEHRIYTETFGGGGSILLRKKRSYAEVYNDSFGDIVNVFRVLRDPTQAIRLKEVCELTPFARDEFNSKINRDEPIEWARGVIFRSFSGFGSGASSSKEYNTGFRANSNRSGTTPAHDWANWPSHIEAFTERLRGVVIENRDAIDVLRQHDSEKTLHYVDPPYVHETRKTIIGNKGVYNEEMTDDQHSDLVTSLKSLSGMVLLSGYRCDLYDDMLKDWRRVDISAMADGAKKRIESIWMNYAGPQTLFT